MRRTLAIAGTSAGLTVALFALIGSTSGAESGIDVPTAGEVVMPFDTVVGLGINASAVQRDDQVAAFEAWQREVFVRQCMADRGHSYVADLIYPSDPLKEVQVRTPSLGLSLVDPATTNRRHLAGLTRAEHERYLQDLYGESLATMEHVAASGEIPAGRNADSFAQGGCKGLAAKQSPSIWDFKKQYVDELLEMRVSVRTDPALGSAGAAFRECARSHGVTGVSSLPELEPAVMEHQITTKQMAEVSAACADSWMASERRALARAQQRFIDDHAAEVAVLNTRGANLLEASRNSQEFADAIRVILSNRK